MNAPDADPNADADAPSSVPLVLLTGFLGAGKTTVLNRVLAAQHHRRVAVLVNELGRIDVDAGLIRARAGDVLELTGGCVCHQVGVQRELLSALDEIIRRSRPDVVVLETTGIAEPAAILRALKATDTDADPDDEFDSGSRSDLEPPSADGRLIGEVVVVTVVDAEAGTRQLDRHEEARDQVITADKILITKLELTAAENLADLHRRLHGLNPHAERAAFPQGDVGTAALVPWLLDARISGTRTASQATATHPDGHPHQPTAAGDGGHQLAAATYVDDAPLIAEALLLAFEALGDRLVRAKGFVYVAGETRRAFLERAGDRTRLDFGAPWGDEVPMTRLVLIGEELDEAALHRQLWACRASGG